ncbi:MAG: glycosyltransferase family 4 protein [Gemmatimonadales bacterium]
MTGASRAAGSAAGLRLALFTDTYPPQINGVAPTLARLVKAVESRGGAVQVVTVSDPDATSDPQVERWPSIPFWAYPQLQMAAPRPGKALDLIEKWKPNLIHSTTEFGIGLSGLFGAREKRVPFVSSYHTHFTAYLRHYKLTVLDAIGWPYLRWFHNAGRITWSPSEIVRQELAANGFRNTRVWSRGVDPDQFHPRFRSNELRRQLGVEDGGLLAIYVGRLAPEKGIHVALEGMRQVMQRAGPKVSFALAGHGPDDARCRATAPPGTVFMGRLTGRALSEFYASADIFVFPSITETFGNVVLEAMASRLALVAPEVGATTELATTETALQFGSQDPAALAGAVERLVQDPALRCTLAQAAFAVAATRTWDAVFDRLVADYRDALKA